MERLKKDLSQGKIAPVYVLSGPEELLKRQAVEAVIDAALGDGDRELNLTRMQWRDAKVDAIVGACRTLPMFGGRNVVVVTGLTTVNAEQSKQLAAYLDDPTPACALVLACDGKGPDMRLKLFKQAKKIGVVETFKALYSNQVPGWISDRMREKGARIDSDAASLLADIVGTDLSALDEATERLYLYAAGSSDRISITLADVENCIARTRVHTVFELTDALGRRRAGDAIQILLAMLQAREPPIRILAMVSRHFRRLMIAQESLASGLAAEEVGRKLNVHGYFLRDFLRQAGMFSQSEYEVLFNRLYATDRLLKSSRASSELHMHNLVLDICTASRPN